MKIVFLSRLFFPHIGGVEKHVIEVSKILIKQGHEVSVITENYAPNMKEIEEIQGIHVYRISVEGNDWFKKLRIWKEIWRLKKVFENADVVHCHDVFYWYLPLRLLYQKKPVYTTFHGYESFPIRGGAIISRKISEKLSWGNICIGDFIQKWYGTKATFVSYGATDCKRIDSLTRNDTLKNKKQSALFIGRLDEQTGILTYAKTVEILKRKDLKFDFAVIGDGKYRNLLNKELKILGFQKNPEKYFQQYHFAFVSRYLSILEAFAQRKLVFAVYDNSVKEDYLKMTPYAKWIVTERDPQKLAEKVVYYLEHPNEEKEMINKAYLWVKDQTWEKLAKIYISLWEKTNISQV